VRPLSTLSGLWPQSASEQSISELFPETSIGVDAP
jgi:hypothetical protein